MIITVTPAAWVSDGDAFIEAVWYKNSDCTETGTDVTELSKLPVEADSYHDIDDSDDDCVEIKTVYQDLDDDPHEVGAYVDFFEFDSGGIGYLGTDFLWRQLAPPTDPQVRGDHMADCIVDAIGGLHAEHVMTVVNYLPDHARAICSASQVTTEVGRHHTRNDAELFDLLTHEITHHSMSGASCTPSDHDSAAFRIEHRRIKRDAWSCRSLH